MQSKRMKTDNLQHMRHWSLIKNIFFSTFFLKFFLDLSDFFPVDNLDTVKTLLKDPDVRTDFTDDVRMTFIISWICIWY